MTEKRTICIAVDTSPHSVEALRWSKEKLLNSNDDIVIVSCLSKPDPTYNEKLKDLVQELTVKDLVILNGDAQKEIVEFVRLLEPQLLVVGSRGLGAVGSLLMGSTSEYLAHNSPVPILIIQ